MSCRQDTLDECSECRRVRLKMPVTFIGAREKLLKQLKVSAPVVLTHINVGVNESGI